MANKPKAWREAGKINTIEGIFTARQVTAFVRQYPQPSGLLINLLGRVA